MVIRKGCLPNRLPIQMLPGSPHLSWRFPSAPQRALYFMTVPCDSLACSARCTTPLWNAWAVWVWRVVARFGLPFALTAAQHFVSRKMHGAEKADFSIHRI